jgi:hypothetical protein
MLAAKTAYSNKELGIKSGIGKLFTTVTVSVP